MCSIKFLQAKCAVFPYLSRHINSSRYPDKCSAWHPLILLSFIYFLYFYIFIPFVHITSFLLLHDSNKTPRFGCVSLLWDLRMLLNGSQYYVQLHLKDWQPGCRKTTGQNELLSQGEHEPSDVMICKLMLH